MNTKKTERLEDKDLDQVQGGFTHLEDVTFTFAKDEKRVNSLFDFAEEAGIDVCRRLILSRSNVANPWRFRFRSLELRDLKEAVRSGSPAVVLVNASRLHCEHCSPFGSKYLKWIAHHAFQVGSVL